ncbi:MAG: hypothetical protein ACREIR_25945, partial [Geminicoccaceae bacterium]
MRRSAGSRVLSAAFALLNRLVPWHRLPALLGMLNLLAFREELREHNLHDASGHGEVGRGSHDNRRDAPGQGEVGRGAPGRRDPRVLRARTVDGSFNDLAQPRMGAAGARFGRNFPIQLSRPEPAPALLGMLNLLAFREELREHNLHDASGHGEVGRGSHDNRR